MSLLADRYELKFVVSAAQHARFRELARDHLVADPHGAQACYRVSSQYFDSPDLRCRREKVDGVADRRKLRLRFYGDVHAEAGFPDRTFFLEIKHRAAETIHKERLRLTAEGARAILADAGELREVAGHAAPADRARAATIANVERLAAARGLVAANVVTYLREAWQGSVDERLRITFDAAIRGLAPHAYLEVSGAQGAPILAPDHFVLEVKFDRAIPVWTKDVLRDLGVRPIRFSKYARAIDALLQSGGVAATGIGAGRPNR